MRAEVPHMPSYVVRERGTDTSGRPIYATDYFWRVWQAVLRRPRVQPFAHLVVVVQGAFMERVGGGAMASAGYHDKGGCWDIRTWNLTLEQQRILWWEAALFGIIFWPRGPSAAMGGMDPHGHAIAGWDSPLAPGAVTQWAQARNRRDGLASNGPDYVTPRPAWVAAPPRELLQEDYMATDEAQRKLDQVLSELGSLKAQLGDLSNDEKQRFVRERDRDKKKISGLVGLLGGLADQLIEIANDADDDATKANVARARDRILSALAEDPDVDGQDNPAVAEDGV